MNDTQQRRRPFGTKAIVLVLSLGALVDFVWSILDRRSVAESVMSAVLGVVGTGWYLLTMWASSKNDPDDPSAPARLVP